MKRYTIKRSKKYEYIPYRKVENHISYRPIQIYKVEVPEYDYLDLGVSIEDKICFLIELHTGMSLGSGSNQKKAVENGLYVLDKKKTYINEDSHYRSFEYFMNKTIKDLISTREDHYDTLKEVKK